MKPITLKVTDDSGLMAIVNAEKYNSFVDADWQLTELMQRFVDEMNNYNLIIWSTGLENNWIVNFMDEPSDNKAFREFSKAIEVTDGQLYLTNYEDLSYVAQFEDEILPRRHNNDLFIKLDNGEYMLTIRQMFDPDDYDYETDENVGFEIIVQTKKQKKEELVREVFWWTN